MKKIAGFDLGKSSIRLVILDYESSSKFKVKKSIYKSHEGRPFEVFSKLYEENNVVTCSAIGATGVYSFELRDPALILPEDSCQEAVLKNTPGFEGPINLISVGGRGYSVLTQNPLVSKNGSSEQYSYQFLENDKCSSGTGENMLKIAGRFGMSIEEADNLAHETEEVIPITARCSVFAKSEMTHFANQGKSADALFKGFFDSVSKNSVALMARNNVDGPVYLVGGCTQNSSLIKAFNKNLGKEINVPENALTFEATGAAILAGEHAVKKGDMNLPSNAEDIIKNQGKHFTVLEPSYNFKNLVTIMNKKKSDIDVAKEPSVLGIDVGSTGSKAVLTSVRTKEPIMSIYDRTQGNPVDAARRLVTTIINKTETNIKAIGLTGSGREAVATLMKAVFPDRETVVINEIVAHATAAILCDDDNGEDLSIIEIGGQDAKFCQIQGGRIVESDMNKACSAGTGSFLEEQAIFYGINDIGTFVELASTSERPPDLGQMCTVYVADTASQALKDGFKLEDIFAGFQYSVINNYLNRVKGQRKLAKRIFFQGKPASNPSLAWSLAGITGREIIVPPDPGSMGAWGIGLCVIDQLESEELNKLSPLNLNEILKADVIERSEFRCKDPKCQTLCAIERTTISVGEEEKTVLSGGACPRYEISTKNVQKLEKNAPNPFDQRNAILRDLNKLGNDEKHTITIGIPQVGALFSFMPWLATFISELGYNVSILLSDSSSLSEGEKMSYSFDACGSVKIAHAVCDKNVSMLFFPKIINYHDEQGRKRSTCITAQALPEIVEKSLKAKGNDTAMIKLNLSFANGYDSQGLIRSLLELKNCLNVTKRDIRSAAIKAAQAQEAFEQELLSIGDNAIRYARANNIPMVVVCGSIHVLYDKSINANIPNLLRQNGTMAIPMDCIRIDKNISSIDKVYWGDSNMAIRASIQARRMNDVYPLMITSFGCGPTSFTEQIFQSVNEDYPYTILESDGHGGAAGFITRIQAFLQTVSQYKREKIKTPIKNMTIEYSEEDLKPDKLSKEKKYVFLAYSDYISPLFAAAYRSFGYDAESTGRNSAEKFIRGKKDCSGKECLPYQMIWGGYVDYLEKNPPEKDTVIFELSGDSCRAGVYSIKDQMTLEKMNLDHKVYVRSFELQDSEALSTKTFVTMAAHDILVQLYVYHLVDSKTSRKLYDTYAQKLVQLVERPLDEGFMQAFQMGRDWRELKELILEASKEYGKLRLNSKAKETKTVLLTGDLYGRFDEFSNAGLYGHLAEKNLRILIEPLCDTIEYISHFRPKLMFGEDYSSIFNSFRKVMMKEIRSNLYKNVIKDHPWLPIPSLEDSLNSAAELLDQNPVGGGYLSIGSVLAHWKKDLYDGAVITNCWGCDNGLVMEALLRHKKEIPMLFIYDDGTPVDERKINSFAFKLNH